MKRLLALAGAIAIAVVTPVHAQKRPENSTLVEGVVVRAQKRPEQPTLVEELVVNAVTPGPAWWSVSKGDAKIWLLGMPKRVPADTVWDMRAFDQRVAATGRVIFLRGGTVTLWNAEAGGKWGPELSPVEQERLAELARREQRQVSWYTSKKPSYAAMLLRGDIVMSRVRPRVPDMYLGRRVRALGAVEIPVDSMRGGAFEDALGGDDMTCIHWVLSVPDLDAANRLRARAWARGDVRALVSWPMNYDPCEQSLKGVPAALAENESALVRELSRRLDKGTSAVVTIGLVPLLRQDGVLDQLRQRGYVVRTPAQLDDPD